MKILRLLSASSLILILAACGKAESETGDKTPVNTGPTPAPSPVATPESTPAVAAPSASPSP